MSALITSFGLDKLSLPDRLALLDELWDTIVVEPDQVPVTDAQKQDLQRRLDAIDADPTRGSTWEEIKGRLID